MKNIVHPYRHFRLLLALLLLPLSQFTFATISYQDFTVDTVYQPLQTSGYKWEFNNVTYHDPGFYKDTIVVNNDSVIGRLVLAVTYADSVVVCGDTKVDSIETPWGNFGFDTCECLTGCLLQTMDSVCLVYAELCIVRLDSTFGDTTAYVCAGTTTFVWRGVEHKSGDTIHLTNAVGCDSIVTLHLAEVPIPSLTISADTMINKGDTASLWANGAQYYSWSPAQQVTDSSAQKVGAFPTTSTEFTVVGYNEAGTNKLVNGDFEQGNTGFTTSYKYYAPKTTNELEYGKYTIGQWASDLWPTYETSSRSDFLGYGNSKYMVVDGSEKPNALLWQETVDVLPDNDYALSCLLVSLLASHKNGNYALLQFYINDQPVGSIFHSPSTLHEWAQFYEVWNSGSATTAKIQIINQNTDAKGNDFGIDNIKFIPLMRECAATEQVTVLVAKYDTVRQSVCETELPYSWHGKDISETGLFTDTIQSLAGYKDSIVTLSLTVLDTTHGDTTAYVCAGTTTYPWRGKNRENGDTIQLTNVAGCDSVVTLHLVSLNQSDSIENETICFGDSLKWYGDTIIKTEGTYYHHLPFTRNNSCDSILFELHLQILSEPDRRNKDTIICKGSIIDFGNRENISTETQWLDTIRTKVGPICDSVITTYSVHVQKDSVVEKNITICRGGSYVWARSGELADSTITTEGEYSAKLLSSRTGCDSIIYKLSVSIDEINKDSINYVTCSNVPYLWRNRSLTETNVYRDTARAKTGTEECDTIFILKLTVLPTSTGTDYLTVCQNAFPFDWNGISIRGIEDNDTTVTLTSLVTGCDSVVTLKLSVLPTSTGTDYLTVCSNAFPFDWNGISVRGIEDNDTTVTLTSEVTGCDSVVTLKLSVLPTTTGTDYLTVCSNAFPFDWNGISIRSIEDNDTTVTLSSEVTGCDSVVTLALVVVDCSHCDSISASVRISDICADDEWLNVVLNVDSGMLDHYQVTFSFAAQQQGFENVAAQVEQPFSNPYIISIPVPKGSNRTQYVRPDAYDIYIEAGDTCEQTLQWRDSFMVYYPSWITDQHWNDAIALLNDQYNGGYSFTHVQWLQNGYALSGENNYYIYLPHELMTNEYHEHVDTLYYQAALTRVDDGKTILTCPLYPQPVYDTLSVTDLFVDVYPTLVHRDNPVVSIRTNTEGTYWLYDVTGKLIKSGDYEPCEHYAQDILLPGTQTMFLFVFTPRDSKKPIKDAYRVVKVLVY